MNILKRHLYVTSGVSPEGLRWTLEELHHSCFLQRLHLLSSRGWLLTSVILGLYFLNWAPFTAVTNTQNTHCLSSDPQMCLLGISRFFSLHMHDLTSLRDLIQRQRSIFFKHPELDPDGIHTATGDRKACFIRGLLLFKDSVHRSCSAASRL